MDEITNNSYKNKLINYVKDSLKKGFNIKDIEKKLKNSNVNLNLIKEVIHEVKKTQKKRNNNNIYLFLLIALTILTVIIFSINNIFLNKEVDKQTKIDLISPILDENMNLSKELAKNANDIYMAGDGTYFDYEESEKLFLEAIELNPYDSQLYTDLGWVYIYSYRYELAEKQFEKAFEFEKSKNNYMTLSGLGNVKQLLKKYNESIYYFKKTVEQSEFIEIDDYKELSKSYLFDGQYDKAHETIDIAINILNKSDSSNYYLWKGNIYLKQKDYIEAEKMYEISIDIDGNMEAKAGKLVILLKTNSTDFVSEKAKMGELKFPQSKIILGDAYMEMSDFDNAIKYYQGAIDSYYFLNNSYGPDVAMLKKRINQINKTQIID
ncbi:tetratricopeptide repeat protein [Candidatus Woesearchaeota archaeon]|jgi:tetratricopeptide (TPR) repeat protein|nr:tetratricopeptide repeat protein [Candidatus Woesearchaeota archaeon]